jgi:hypothetical protein
MDPDVYDEYDTNVIRRFTIPPVHNEMQAFFVPRVELTVESGVGNSAETDPQVTMYFSRDGRTWSDGRKRSVGEVGEYAKRVVWRRNGRFPRMMVLRFDMSDPVKWCVLALHADIEGADV